MGIAIYWLYVIFMLNQPPGLNELIWGPNQYKDDISPVYEIAL